MSCFSTNHKEISVKIRRFRHFRLIFCVNSIQTDGVAAQCFLSIAQKTKYYSKNNNMFQYICRCVCVQCILIKSNILHASLCSRFAFKDAFRHVLNYKYLPTCVCVCMRIPINGIALGAYIN